MGQKSIKCNICISSIITKRGCVLSVQERKREERNCGSGLSEARGGKQGNWLESVGNDNDK